MRGARCEEKALGSRGASAREWVKHRCRKKRSRDVCKSGVEDRYTANYQENNRACAIRIGRLCIVPWVSVTEVMYLPVISGIILGEQQHCTVVYLYVR